LSATIRNAENPTAKTKLGIPTRRAEKTAAYSASRVFRPRPAARPSRPRQSITWRYLRNARTATQPRSAGRNGLHLPSVRSSTSQARRVPSASVFVLASPKATIASPIASVTATGHSLRRPFRGCPSAAGSQRWRFKELATRMLRPSPIVAPDSRSPMAGSKERRPTKKARCDSPNRIEATPIARTASRSLQAAPASSPCERRHAITSRYLAIATPAKHPPNTILIVVASPPLPSAANSRAAVAT